MIMFMRIDCHGVLRIHGSLILMQFFICVYACISFCYGPHWEVYHVGIMGKLPPRIGI